ncbi:MAG: HNH endonuclease [Bacteroidales bacterium]
MFKEYYSYLVYEDGKVFSKKSNKFLKGDITKHGYIQYCLSLDGEKIRIKAHRLVAKLFIEEIEGKNIVNHIDGNKLNNHYSNLEWCDYYHNNKHARDTGLNNVSKSNSERWKNKEFRERTSKKFSEALKGVSIGSKNPKFRYLILKDDKEITRQELKEIIKRSLSNTDVLIKKSAQGEEIELFKENKIEVYDTKKGQQTIERVLCDLTQRSNQVEYIQGEIPCLEVRGIL